MSDQKLKLFSTKFGIAGILISTIFATASLTVVCIKFFVLDKMKSDSGNSERSKTEIVQNQTANDSANIFNQGNQGKIEIKYGDDDKPLYPEPTEDEMKKAILDSIETQMSATINGNTARKETGDIGIESEITAFKKISCSYDKNRSYYLGRFTMSYNARMYIKEGVEKNKDLEQIINGFNLGMQIGILLEDQSELLSGEFTQKDGKWNYIEIPK